MKSMPTLRTVGLLTVMLVVSVALNVGLALKVHAFMTVQEEQLARLQAMDLKAGVKAPPLSAKRVGDSSGAVEIIDYAGARPTVLYVLSPACGRCAKNESSIKKLIAEKGAEYRFIGISLADEGVLEYQAKHGLGVALYSGVNEQTRRAYKMSGTPQTIVVSTQGVVVASWSGAYLGKQKDAVEKFFEVELPDIEPEKSS